MRIELTTSSLPRKCSTTELQRLVTALGSISPKQKKNYSSGRPGSNRPPEAWKATALPNELLPLVKPGRGPVCYNNHPPEAEMSGQEWIRTTEVERQRIYSPPHLAALEPAHFAEPEKGLEPPTS